MPDTPFQRLGIVVLASLALLLAACTATGPARVTETTALQARGSVILISLDGVHPDYLERGLTPRINALAAAGVRARWMTPSFPSMTFPNHYTLVTGLRPDRHGIIDNRMRDPVLGGFRMQGQSGARDGRWWDDAEPLWVTARRAGLQTATMFWPGSEAEIRGLRPHQWLPFSTAPSPAQRVDQVLSWLGQPDRPHFITLYFEQADQAGHAHGPRSTQVDRQLTELDAAIGRLIDGIAALGLHDHIDLVLVSDHGMAASPVEQIALLDDYIDPGQVQLVTIGELTTLTPDPEQTQAVETALLGRHAHFECWRRDALPPRWKFGTHRRVPAIVCLADEGWRLATRRWLQAGGRAHLGAHGYEPTLPSMRALFIAQGPSFRAGVVVKPFDNVEVYPLLTELLGIEPQPNDSRGRTRRGMLR